MSKLRRLRSNCTNAQLCTQSEFASVVCELKKNREMQTFMITVPVLMPKSFFLEECIVKSPRFYC